MTPKPPAPNPTSTLVRHRGGIERFEPPNEKRLFEAFLSGRSPSTQAAYKADLEHFAKFLGLERAPDAVAQYLAAAPGAANAKILDWRNHMRDAGRAPATINRRLATMRSITKLARMLGQITWSLEIESLRNAPYRDTAGPGLEVLQMMYDAISKRDDAKGHRDYAICRLMFDLGLRRGEIVGLNVEHISSRGLSVRGKAKLTREILTLPPSTRAALDAWLAVRPGDLSGPMFVRLDHEDAGTRLTGDGIYALVRYWSDQIGQRTHPHGIRHTAVTTVLDQTNGNIRAGQSFARHVDPKTTLRYDDARRDDRGQAAATIAALITRR